MAKETTKKVVELVADPDKRPVMAKNTEKLPEVVQEENLDLFVVDTTREGLMPDEQPPVSTTEYAKTHTKGEKDEKDAKKEDMEM